MMSEQNINLKTSSQQVDFLSDNPLFSHANALLTEKPVLTNIISELHQMNEDTVLSAAAQSALNEMDANTARAFFSVLPFEHSTMTKIFNTIADDRFRNVFADASLEFIRGNFEHYQLTDLQFGSNINLLLSWASDDELHRLQEFSNIRENIGDTINSELEIRQTLQKEAAELQTLVGEARQRGASSEENKYLQALRSKSDGSTINDAHKHIFRTALKQTTIAKLTKTNPQAFQVQLNQINAVKELLEHDSSFLTRPQNLTKNLEENASMDIKIKKQLFAFSSLLDSLKSSPEQAKALAAYLQNQAIQEKQQANQNKTLGSCLHVLQAIHMQAPNGIQKQIWSSALQGVYSNILPTHQQTPVEKTAEKSQEQKTKKKGPLTKIKSFFTFKNKKKQLTTDAKQTNKPQKQAPIK